MIAVFNIIFILIGLAFLLPILAAAVAFLLKVSVGSAFVSFTFMVKSYEILSKKWWVWLIQLPILFFQIAMIIAIYKGESLITGLFFILLLQMCSSGIIYNIQRVIDDKKKNNYPIGKLAFASCSLISLSWANFSAHSSSESVWGLIPK